MTRELPGLNLDKSNVPEEKLSSGKLSTPYQSVLELFR